jgi:O-antigen/teichoic acid export membrane protein
VRWERAAVKPLLTFGGWMTVTNVVSPLMNTLDRFVVGAALSINLVTYYATPHEVVTKMWLFTAALLPVFFPAFATSVATDPARTSALFDRAVRATFAALLLPTLVLVMLGREVLTVWLGAEFALQSAGVMQTLAVAIFVNTIGQCALTLLQALGRPDLTGKYHLVELPLYALLLWYLLPRFGILGVAIAWAVRAILDSVVLLFTCPVLLPESRQPVRRALVWLAVALPVLGASAAIPTTAARVLTFAVAAPVWIFVAWRWILTPAERAAPKRVFGIALARD